MPSLNGTMVQQTVEQEREQSLSLVFETWAQGGAAFTQEGQLLTSQDWGFDLVDVKYEPVCLWHGTDDDRVDIRYSRHMAEQTPHAILKEYEHSGHFDIMNHMQEILTELLSHQTTMEQYVN